MIEGVTVGVFGTDKETKTRFESSVAKKSETGGIEVYVRTEAGRRLSFLDTPDFPERVQGYAGIASIADHAIYCFPSSGKLAAPDGELAVLLGSFGLPGTLMLFDGSSSPAMAAGALKGTAPADYPVEERQSDSAAVDLAKVAPNATLPRQRTLVYVDRAFSVKGVGTVALGFVLSGKISVHDQLRPVPGPSEKRADVKSIQVSDVDQDSVGRGVRVGLSLRGIEAGQLQSSHWLDDGSFSLSAKIRLQVERSPFYKQEIGSRDLHLQVAGETIPASLSPVEGGLVDATLPWELPTWDGMRAAVLDLNGRSLRVAASAMLSSG